MHLQDLSVDVLTPILDSLAVRDLLACKQVSRYLLEVIDGSERLQYKIDLAVAGMVDGPPSALCTAERRSMLREYQKAWCSLELPVRPNLTIPVPTNLSLLDHLRQCLIGTYIHRSEIDTTSIAYQRYALEVLDDRLRCQCPWVYHDHIRTGPCSGPFGHVGI
ncbi:hypothetical protein B0H21DRAFT_492444 [Amylocystis lapponica]|nr:hypothetical protein B0H21DRAFT_492444 [Amylocystis lapponica]